MGLKLFYNVVLAGLNVYDVDNLLLFVSLLGCKQACNCVAEAYRACPFEIALPLAVYASNHLAHLRVQRAHCSFELHMFALS